MELERAFEALGLDRDASAADVEAAYRALCDDIDARTARAPTAAIRRRFGDARVELEAAREVVLASLASDGEAALQAGGEPIAELTHFRHDDPKPFQLLQRRGWPEPREKRDGDAT